MHASSRPRCTARLARLTALLAVLLLIATLAPVHVAGAGVQQPSPALTDGLTSVLEVSRASVGAPGALLYVAGPGVGSYTGSAGVANLATGAPLTPDTPVRIASVTKPFVAVVVLQLVQEGWLRLDQSVEHWLPGLVPGGEQITIRQLLQHTSGLGDYLSGGIVGRARREPGHVFTPQELVAEGLRRPRLFAPGAPGRWYYSNTNFILLGMIVERATGNSLAAEIQQRIVKPLKLRDTALDPATAEPGRLARGYVRGRDYTVLNISVAWAAGGMHSTVADVGIFLRALARGELLRPETVAAMEQWHGTGGVWGVPDLAYGLGLMRRTLPEAAGLGPAARVAIGHTGALAGYKLAAWYLPERDLTIVVALTSFEAEPNVVLVRTLETLVTQGVLKTP